MAPPWLTPRLQSLPPMLHIMYQNPMLGCSEGARGLSVCPRVTGVFTGASTSLSGSSRQRSLRYAIHAGRNLPDKEFRYLRTVIVTAAVYRGFSSKLLPEGITSFLNLPAPGRRQSLYVRLTFAETCVFGKQSREPIHCDLLRASDAKSYTLMRHPLSRSYGARLPSSWTSSHSSALGYYPYLPVLVYGTVTNSTDVAAFLGSIDSTGWLVRRRASPLSSGLNDPPDLPGRSPYDCGRALPIARGPIFLRPHDAHNALSVVREY